MGITTAVHQVRLSPELSDVVDKQIERKISTYTVRKESTRRPQSVPLPPPAVLNDSTLRGEVVNMVA